MMKVSSKRQSVFHVSRFTFHAFTLIEVMLAMAILALVVTAIYTSWIAIVKGSKIGAEVAAAAQRQRMAMRMIEDALASTQLFVENVNLYAFIADKDALSFVARLPKTYPRSGKFGDFAVRRVTFSMEAGGDGENQLVVRQNPLLLEVDKDEQQNPLVLARNVKEFRAEFWDTRLGDWIDEWITTNQLPRMVKVYLRLGSGNQKGFQNQNSDEEVTRIIGLPTVGVQSSWQAPGLQQGGGRLNPRGGQSMDPPIRQIPPRK